MNSLAAGIRPSSIVLSAVVLTSLVMPGFAQQGQQSPCQAALQQVQQADNQITLNHQNAEQQLATNQANALLDCQKQAVAAGANSGTQQANCVKQVDATYTQASLSLQQAANTAYGTEAQIANDLRSGPSCSWSAEQITQMISQLSQAAAQLGTSAAQIITAAKGKGATAPTSPSGGGSAPKSPSPTSGSPGSPKAPTSPTSPGTTTP